MAAKIKKGDKVVVITGRDKGRTGEVIEIYPGDPPRRRARRPYRAPPSAPDRETGRRHHLEGSAASTFPTSR